MSDERRTLRLDADEKTVVDVSGGRSGKRAIITDDGHCTAAHPARSMTRAGSFGATRGRGLTATGSPPPASSRARTQCATVL
jgi:hypothetical protein